MTVQGHTASVGDSSQRFLGTTSVDDVLRFQVHRLITHLFKSLLCVIEDLGEDHDKALRKLHEALPDQYRSLVTLADHFDEAKGKQLRSRILDAGNDCLRDVDAQIQFYDIALRTPKN